MTWAEIEREREFVEDFSNWLRCDVGGSFGAAADGLWQELDATVEEFPKLQRLSHRIERIVDAWEEDTAD